MGADSGRRSDDWNVRLEWTQPSALLLKYYFLQSLIAGPFFFLLFIPLYCKYHTLRYQFHEEGVVVRWGILFRREISVGYERIQDIHLMANVVERWLGLGRIQLQTASGQASAEMVIEGFTDYRAIRDFLYAQMYGTSSEEELRRPSAEISQQNFVPVEDLVEVLNKVAEETRAIRKLLEQQWRDRSNDRSH